MEPSKPFNSRCLPESFYRAVQAAADGIAARLRRDLAELQWELDAAFERTLPQGPPNALVPWAKIEQILGAKSFALVVYYGYQPGKIV